MTKRNNYSLLFLCQKVSFNYFVFVSDPPGPAFIQKDIDRVIKGDSITLTCNVAEPGNDSSRNIQILKLILLDFQVF